jgi:hypothetical protein
LISLMNEQREKVNKASTFEEESRYSQRTMADLRENLAGTKAIYGLFQPWLVTKPAPKAGAPSGAADDEQILAGFAKLDSLYDHVSGDSIPQPPSSWAAEAPSKEDLGSPFGVLYTGVQQAVDPEESTSVVGAMSAAATILGFPEFVEGN